MPQITCPHCSTLLEITDQHRGRAIRCQRCGEAVRVPAAVQEPIDVLPAYPQSPGSKSLCEKCLNVAPTAHVIFHQHVGAVVLMFHKHIDANLCRECIDRTYSEFQTKTLLMGWWGFASFFITPFCLLLN